VAHQLGKALWLALLASLSAGALCTDSRSVSKQDYWMGVYYSKQKIGSFHVTVGKDKLDGKDIFVRKEALRIRYRVTGNSILYNVDRTVCVDGSLQPVSDRVMGDYKDDTMTGYRPTATDIRYSPLGKTTKTITGDETSQTTITWDDETRTRVIAGYAYDFGRATPSVGNRLATNHFRYGIPLSRQFVGLKLGPGSVCVMRREPLKLNGTTYSTLVVSERGEDTDITTWQLENGEVVKQESPADEVVWLRESKEKATEVDDGKGPLLNSDGEPADTTNASIQPPKRAPTNLDYWLGIYVGSQKMGDVHVTVKPDKLDGEDVFR
jgi:hypothetical protein